MEGQSERLEKEQQKPSAISAPSQGPDLDQAAQDIHDVLNSILISPERIKKLAEFAEWKKQFIEKNKYKPGEGVELRKKKELGIATPEELKNLEGDYNRELPELEGVEEG
ncbi:MAG: hypothetical protein A2V81_02580 [Candidatus Abawacabacteria bacterium RBG_16_42_10]|uniref:Uncharacterized protein n=1 Tax=Candidatus Abawacabacteria bacterium RBG_16_42_10 TaxID=1817814 RepID=A0A1F4XL59_9BACT|nr:MAG: hypothetical protein A2V81_02580 [Candidatus Abawacabacteria bacterium RBG_16_42_10]